MIEASRREEQEGARASRTKVLLANGHRLFKSGLREILTSVGEDIEVLGEAQDDEEAVERAKEMEPDVVVLDIVGPSAKEQKTIDRMLEASPGSGWCWSPWRGILLLVSPGSSWRGE